MVGNMGDETTRDVTGRLFRAWDRVRGGGGAGDVKALGSVALKSTELIHHEYINVGHAPHYWLAKRRRTIAFQIEYAPKTMHVKSKHSVSHS